MQMTSYKEGSYISVKETFPERLVNEILWYFYKTNIEFIEGVKSVGCTLSFHSLII